MMIKRNLGSFEKLIWHAGHVNSFNFVTIAQLKGNLPSSILRKALDTLQPSYPMLNVNVVYEKNDYFFSTIDSPIPLTSKLAESENQWLDEVNYELNLIFNEANKPLVRMILLSSDDHHTIIVTFNHIIADALSGLHFLYRLISVCDQFLDNNSIQIKPFRLLPSIEDLQKDKNGLEEDVNLSNIIKPTEYNVKSEISTSIINYKLSLEETTTIIKICKLYELSVHSYICSALSAALFKIKSNTLDKLICLSPINMRPYLYPGVGSEEMGYLLSRVDSQVWNKPDFTIIENAKLIDDQITKFIDLGIHNEILYNINNISSLYFSSNELYNNIQFNAPGLLISNVGKLKFDSKNSNLKVESLHFALACQGILGNKNSMGATVTTFNDQMNINFHYIEPRVSKAEAMNFAEIALKNLIK